MILAVWSLWNVRRGETIFSMQLLKQIVLLTICFRSAVLRKWQALCAKSFIFLTRGKNKHWCFTQCESQFESNCVIIPNFGSFIITWMNSIHRGSFECYLWAAIHFVWHSFRSMIRDIRLNWVSVTLTSEWNIQTCVYLRTDENYNLQSASKFEFTKRADAFSRHSIRCPSNGLTWSDDAASPIVSVLLWQVLCRSRLGVFGVFPGTSPPWSDTSRCAELVIFEKVWGVSSKVHSDCKCLQARN